MSQAPSSPAEPSGRSSRGTALITGASAGIGRELAKEFAAHNYDLVLTARRQEALKQLAAELSSAHGTTVHVVSADLSKPNGAADILNFTVDGNLKVDVLVNNAGFGANGAFAQLGLNVQLEMLQVNITSLVELSRVYLPSMLASRQGGILNVASTAAFVPGPFMTVYYATKAFVLSFSEALANEVAGSGVTISCLCPGATITEFQERAKIATSKLFAGPHVMTAAQVAKQGYQGFASGKQVVITGLFNELAVLSSRLIPRAAAAGIARSLQEPPKN